ncbi:MAG: large conductance mechanosensitive channel protein MscL [Gemmatales bacterium]|nr:large conductance mechanosensitive channel protein MscL [Gemmatales bacterium]MDW8386436.1 large conductance mechanosensitive channel protein MscL [Gemmatales bacterium]
MGILSEFRTFIQRGNVIDMAVGIIMGTAFTKIVHSLVNDVLMPLLGFVMAGIHVSDLVLPLSYGDQVVNIYYGKFLQAVVDFLIVAACVFALVKTVNALKAPLPFPVPLPWLGFPGGPSSTSPPAPAPTTAPPAVAPQPSEPEPRPEIQLLTEIRDALQALRKSS